MAKNILIVILCVCIILSFFVGFQTSKILYNSNTIGNTISDTMVKEDVYNSKSLVGIYETESWNGEPAILVLYEDGTSQYPSDRASEWRVSDNLVVFTVKGLEYDNGRQALTAYFNHDLQEAEMNAISQTIGTFTNVESTNLLVDEYQSRIYIKLLHDDENNEAYNSILEIDGIRSVEYEYRQVESYTEHEAIIMENGLILHGKFFEKVSG